MQLKVKLENKELAVLAWKIVSEYVSSEKLSIQLQSNALFCMYKR